MYVNILTFLPMVAFFGLRVGDFIAVVQVMSGRILYPWLKYPHVYILHS